MRFAYWIWLVCNLSSSFHFFPPLCPSISHVYHLLYCHAFIVDDHVLASQDLIVCHFSTQRLLAHISRHAQLSLPLSPFLTGNTKGSFPQTLTVCDNRPGFYRSEQVSANVLLLLNVNIINQLWFSSIVSDLSGINTFFLCVHIFFSHFWSSESLWDKLILAYGSENFCHWEMSSLFLLQTIFFPPSLFADVFFSKVNFLGLGRIIQKQIVEKNYLYARVF